MAISFNVPFLLTVLLIHSISCNNETDPVVTVAQGRLKGAVEELLDGTPYFSFKGIPYAQAPIGQLRFTAPLPPQSWNGTHEAINHGPVCPQYDVVIQQFVEGDEKCLLLNIYTKSLKPDSKLPVMVYIHGGAYMSGSGDSTGLGPEFLLPHDVILVTINYRLEVLGFLSLDTPEVPGNAGMKDQVFALRWIQENIAQFGGDPDNVTIFGESAGATSVIFHIHSPMSKGLFHKAIAQSGVSLCDCAQGKNGKERAFRVGKLLGKETTDSIKLLAFLRSVPTIKLTNVTFTTMTDDEKLRGLPVQFAPVVEKKFDNVEPFLTVEALDSLLTKKINAVPLMVGYTSDEAIIMVAEELGKINFTNHNSQYLVPREVAQKVSQNKLKEFGERLMNFYVGNRDFTKDDAQILSDLNTDRHFVYNIHRFSHFYSSIQPTYMYRFSLDTDLNIVKNVSGFKHLKGACHADDLFYLFYNIWNKKVYEEQPRLREIVHRVTKMWTDFAKSGNPTPDNSLDVKWTPYSPPTKYYLDINEKLSIGQNAEQDRVEIWNKVYCDAGVPCISFK